MVTQMCECSMEVTQRYFADYDASRGRPALATSWDEVLRSVTAFGNRDGVLIIHARDKDQFNDVVRRALRGGRIPGAISIPRRTLLQPDGTLESVEQQRLVFLQSGVDPASPNKHHGSCRFLILDISPIASKY